MVGIVSSKDLGLFNSSLDVLGRSNGQSTIGQGNGQDFVNIATGNLSIQFLDKSLSGTGADLMALRTYNSQGALTDGDADGWRWSGEARVSLSGTINSAGSTITRTLGDGNQTVYAWNGSAYVSTAGSGAHDSITWNGVNEYLWNSDSSGDVIERYDSSTGWIKSRRDTSGNGFDFTFVSDKLTSVKDVQSGQSLELTYGSSGKLARIDTRTSAGGALTQQVYYAYDAWNRLASVTTDLTPSDNNIADGVTYVTNYTYDGTSNRIASIAQSDGTLVNFTYDASNRISTVTDASGTSVFVYSANSTSVSNGNGEQWIYSFDANKQLTKYQSPAVGGVAQSASYTYDASGNVASITDGRGNTSNYTYDANGNNTKEVDALGNTVTRTFSAANQLLTETRYTIPSLTTPSGVETRRYVYDSANRLRFTVSAEGRVDEMRYTSLGQVAQSIQYAGGIYDVSALSLSASLTEAQLTAWVATQDKTQTQLGEYTYDYRGNLSKTISYAKVDATGAGVLDNAAEVSEFVYSEYGQLLQTLVDRGVGRATKSVLQSVVYDGLGRQTSVVSESGTTTIGYNGVQTTVANSASGLSVVSATDNRGRLLSVTASGDATNRSTTYVYDNAGRLRIAQDPTGARSYTFYDAAGHVSARIDALGDASAYTYDADGRVLTETRYANRIYTGSWTSLATTPAGISPVLDAVNDRVTTYAYDAAGRLTTTTIAGGIDSLVTSYDGESRVTQTTQGARTTRYFYDKDGLQIGQLNAENVLSENTYDGAGRLIKTTTYGTAVATQGSFSAMKSAVVAGDALSSYFFYDADGRLVASVNNQGFLTETVYDEVNNRRKTVQYATAVVATSSSSLASLRALAGASETTTVYFDSFGRVDNTVSVDGSVTRRVYDANGRLVREVFAEGTTDQTASRIRYNAFGEVTGTVSGVGEATLSATASATEISTAITNYGTRYDIDGAGRKIAEYQPDGQKTYLFYNAGGQLAYTVNALGEVNQFTYNAFGQLIQSQTYTGRIDVTGLTGGAVTSTLTTRITAIANAASDRVETTTYNKAGLTDSITDAEGFRTLFGYNTYGEQVSERRYIAASTTLLNQFGRDNLGRVVWTKKDADFDGANLITSQTVYDAYGRVKSSIDGTGASTTLQYLDSGRTLLITDATGHTNKTEVDFLGRTLKTYDGANNLTLITYDDATRSVTLTAPDGASITTTKTRTGNTLSVTDAKGNLTSYTYDANGELKTAVDAMGNTVADNTYDKSGRLIQSKDAKGTVTTYTYDAANRLIQKVVDPTGLNIKTSYGFDGQGRQVSITSAAGSVDAVVTQYQYNRNGQLTQVIADPSGLAISTRFTFDGLGNIVKMEKGTQLAPAQEETVYRFDKLGRKISESVDPTGLNITTSYQYDNSDRLIQKTDANGNATRYVYDAAGRLHFTITAEGYVSETVYDANGNISQLTKFASVPNLLGNYSDANVSALVDRANANNHTQRFTYDANNRLHFTVNGDGAVTETLYDANSNIVKTTEFAVIPALTGNESDAAISALVDRTNVNNHVKNFAYDNNNRLHFTVDAEGAVTENTYDANGNIVAVTEFATVPNLAGNYTEANINAAVDRANVNNHIQRFAYDKLNRLRYSMNAEGFVRENVYDARGNIVKATAFSAVPTTLTDYSELAFQSALNYADTTNQSTNYVYDRNNRLRYSIDAENYVSENNYDSTGNITSFTRFANRLSALTTYSESTVNAVLNRTDVNNHTTNMVFDKANRLRYLVTPEGVVTENSYDALGNRIQTTQFASAISLSGAYTESAVNALLNRADVSNRTQRFAFDKNNHLRFSINAEGAVSERIYDTYGNTVKTVEYAAVPNLLGDYSLSNINNTVDRTNTDNHITYFTYDKNNRLHFMVNAEGSVTESLYDAMGNTVKRIEFAAVPNLLGDYTDANITTSIDRANSGNRVTYLTYDRNNRVHFVVNAEGAVSENAYDAYGNLIKATQFASTPSLLGNYSDSNINTSVDRANANNRVSYFTFNKNNQLHFSVNAEGAVTESVYDANGNTVKSVQFAAVPALLGNYSDTNINSLVDRTHLKNRTTYFTYDKNNRLHFTINAEGAASVNNYDASGNLISVTAYAVAPTLAGNYTDSAIAAAVNNTDANNRTTNYVYDKNNRMRFMIDAEKYVSETTYDTAGNVATVTQFAARVTSASSYTLASINALVDRTNVANRVTAYQYDRANRQTKTTLTGWYDVSDGRVYAKQDTETDRFQRTIEVTYDAFGNAVANKMRTGMTDYVYQYKTYDKLNRKVNDIDALGFVTQTTYDSLGNAKIVTRGATAVAIKTSGYWRNADVVAQTGRSIVTDFDKLGRKIKVTQPSTNTLYRAQDYLTQTSGGGAYYAQASSVTYTYDALGNLVKQSSPVNDLVTADVYFYYDKLGQQTLSVNAENYGTKTEYDVFGDATRTLEYASKSSTNPAIGIAPAFVASAKDRDTAQTYDNLGHVKTVSRRLNGAAVNTQVSVNTYNAFGEITASEDVAHNITRIEYNHIGQQTKIVEPARTVASAGVDVFVGQRKLSPTTVINYDAFGSVVDQTQLEDVTSTSGRKITFAYDAAGNQISVTNALSNVMNFQYDVAGHVTAQKQTVAVTSTALSYNHTIERRFEYDKTGRQVSSIDIVGAQKTGQVNVYNAYGEVVEVRNVWGSSADSTASLMANHLSNVIVNSYTYDAAGRVQTKRGADGYTYYYYDLLDNVTRAEIRGTDNTNTAGARVTEMVYDKLGNILFQRLPQFSATTSFGSATTALYTPTIYQTADRWGNVTFRASGGMASTYAYNQDNQVISEQTSQQAMLKLDQTSQQIYHYKTNQYDARGNLFLSTDAAYVYGTNIFLGAQSSLNVYNEASQLTQTIAAYGSGVAAGTAYTYDSFGNRVGTRDAVGHVFVDDFDANNQLVRHSIVRVNQIGEYLTGQVGSTPMKVNLTDYSYDGAGRQWRVGNYADNTHVAYQYYQFDQRNNIVKSVNEVGVTKEYKFDILNNKIEEKTDLTATTAINQHNWDFTYSYAYGGTTVTDYVDYRVNLATTHAVAGLSYAYAYNDFGQVQSETTANITKVWNYWENGLQKSVHDEKAQYYFPRVSSGPGIIQVVDVGQTDYSYDRNGNRTIEHNQSYQTSKTAYALTDFTTGNTVSSTQQNYDDTYNYFSYDSASRLSQLKSTSAAIVVDGGNYTTSTINLMTYAYDEWGNRRRIESNYTLPNATAKTKTEWFDYDASNRVVIDAGVLEGGKVVASKSGGSALYYDKLNRLIGRETWQRTGSDQTDVTYGNPVFEMNNTTTHTTNGVTVQKGPALTSLNFDAYDLKTYSYNDLSLVKTSDEFVIKRNLNANTSVAAAELYELGTAEVNTYNNRGFKLSSVLYDYNGGRTYAGNSGRSVTYVVREDGSMIGQTTKLVGTNIIESSTDTYIYDAAGQLNSYRTNIYSIGASSSSLFAVHQYKYTYESTYSGQQISRIDVVSSQADVAPKSTSNFYDHRGRLRQAFVSEANLNNSNDIGTTKRQFIYNQANQVVIRAEKRYGSLSNYKLQDYVYNTNGQEITDLGTMSDVNLSPLDAVFEGGNTPSSYTVNGGDTLMAIAQSVFGDGQFWYLIADANGLSMGPTSAFDDSDIGRILQIPNTVKSIRNTNANYKPYSASATYGNLTPAQKLAPVYQTLPAPQQHGCSTLAIIIMVVVAVVVTVLTEGAAAELIGIAAEGATVAETGLAVMAGTLPAVEGLSTGVLFLAEMGIATIGAFAGSVASQYVGKALGVVDKVSWKDAFAAGFTGGAMSGLGGVVSLVTGPTSQISTVGKLSLGAAKGAANYSLSYVSNKVVGLESDFKCSEMFTSMFSTALMEGTNNYGLGESIGAGFANDMINSTATFGFSRLVTKDKEKFTWGMAAAAATDAFGNALANSLVKGIIISSKKGVAPALSSNQQDLSQLKAPESSEPTIVIPDQPFDENCLVESLDKVVPVPDNLLNPTVVSEEKAAVQLPPAPEKITVKDGDNYWRIARRILGKGAKNAQVLDYTIRLFGRNGDKKTIFKGDELILPEADYKASSQSKKLYEANDAEYQDYLKKIAEAKAREEAAANANVHYMGGDDVRFNWGDATQPAKNGMPGSNSTYGFGYSLNDKDSLNYFNFYRNLSHGSNGTEYNSGYSARLGGRENYVMLREEFSVSSTKGYRNVSEFNGQATIYDFQQVQVNGNVEHRIGEKLSVNLQVKDETEISPLGVKILTSIIGDITENHESYTIKTDHGVYTVNNSTTAQVDIRKGYVIEFNDKQEISKIGFSASADAELTWDKWEGTFKSPVFEGYGGEWQLGASGSLDIWTVGSPVDYKGDFLIDFEKNTIQINIGAGAGEVIAGSLSGSVYWKPNFSLKEYFSPILPKLPQPLVPSSY